MQGRRVLFITSGASAPSTLYRILPYVPRLRAAGVHCDVAHSFPQKYDYFRVLGWRLSQALKRSVRWIQFWQARRRRYDAIVIEREVFDLPDWSLEQAFRSATPRLIVDVDDAIFLRYPEKFRRIAGLADCMLAGNRWLAEECRRDCQDVRLLPTAIDLKEYPQCVPDRSQGPAVIGWIGTPANLGYLNQIVPALTDLAKEHAFRLRVITDHLDRMEEWSRHGFPVEFRRWRKKTAVKELRQFTVGVMPLPDGDWERYKCGFKLLQYMACGLPAVASPVGVNPEIIQSGVNGLLAESLENWRETLSLLLQEPTLRSELGQHARRTIEERYSIDGHFETLAAALISGT